MYKFVEIFAVTSLHHHYTFLCLLKSGNACHQSVQDFVFSSVSKNIIIRIYKVVILPLVLLSYEICSLTLRKKHRLRVFENRVLRIVGL
jgi:hypothetical protein